MIKIDWKELFKRVGIFLGIIIIIVSVQRHINNEISTRTQLMQESCEKQKSDIQLDLEQKRLEEKTRLEKEIIEYKTQLEKAKILIEKMETQRSYSELIKKDVKKFMKEFDDLFGVKGK